MAYDEGRATDPFNLDRFLEAQAADYATALAELRSGRKCTHWIWYVFPQLRGLGVSATSAFYGITGLAEARAYLAHPVLGDRFRECVRAMLAHEGVSARDVLGEVDAMKLRSCLTLFWAAAPGEVIFATALERYFAGESDAKTITALNR